MINTVMDLERTLCWYSSYNMVYFIHKVTFSGFDFKPRG